MSDELVQVILKLLNVREFVQGSEQASKAIGGVGTAAEKSGKKAGVSWKSIAKWGGAAGAVYGATRFLKSAVSTTEDLGKSSLALNRVTGMNIQTSAEWSTVLKARNVSTQTFQRGLTTLSKQMMASNTAVAKASQHTAELRARYQQIAETGGKKAPAALKVLQRQIETSTAKGEQAVSMWKALGVNLDDVRQGRTQKVLGEVSDGLSKMTNKADRAALTQKLFSRSGLQLNAVLYGGSKAINDQLKTAGKYVDFHAKSAKQVAEEAQHQRELKMAYMGVQVSLGQALLPVMLSVSQLLLKIANIAMPLIKRGWLLKGVLLALAAAFVIFKGVMIAAQVATAAATLAEMGLNAALLLNPVGLVILAIVALVATIVILWKKCAWFRDMVYAVWGALQTAFFWAKANWPLLVGILGGPFGIAAVMIIRYWDQIKAAIFAVWDWIKKNWPLLVGILVGPVGIAVQQVIAHWSDLKNAAGRAFDWIIGKVKQLLGLITSIPSKIKSAVKSIPGAGILGKAAGAAGSVGGWLSHPHLQHGGDIVRGGAALVGEAGPELVQLPAAARVIPLPAAAGFGAGAITLRVPVYLDRRQIAEAVGMFTADKVARR